MNGNLLEMFQQNIFVFVFPFGAEADGGLGLIHLLILPQFAFTSHTHIHTDLPNSIRNFMCQMYCFTFAFILSYILCSTLITTQDLSLFDTFLFQLSLILYTYVSMCFPLLRILFCALFSVQCHYRILKVYIADTHTYTETERERELNDYKLIYLSLLQRSPTYLHLRDCIFISPFSFLSNSRYHSHINTRVFK